MTAITHRRPARSWPVVAQWLRFAAVGVSNTVVSLGIYAALLDAGVWYVSASAAAFVVATCNSYVLNRRWTFRSGGRRGPEFVRFFAFSAVGLGVNAALLYALVDGASAPRFGAQLVVIPLVSVLTFALNRRWTFGRATEGVRSAHPT